MKKVGTGILALLFALSLMFPAAVGAGPPDYARGGDPPGQSGDHVPPGQSEEGPPGLRGRDNGNGEEENNNGEDNGDHWTPPGLRDKGGLPPGMHGRDTDELPPGIRHNPNFQEAIESLFEKDEEEEKEETEVDGVILSGANKITIPEDEEDEVVEEYSAVLGDQYDQEMEGEEVSLSFSDDYNGAVTFEDGKLTVTSDAEAGTYELEAVYEVDDGEDIEVTFEIELTELEA